MKLKELVEKIDAGQIKFDNRGHMVNNYSMRIKEEYNFYLSMYNKYQDELNSEIKKEPKTEKEKIEKQKRIDDLEGHIEYYKQTLDIDIIPGKWLFLELEEYCFDCGNRLKLTMFNNETIGLMSYNEYSKIKYKPGFYDVNKLSSLPQCEAGKLSKARRLTTQLEFKNKNVVFLNFFRNENLFDLPKDLKYKTEYDLCSVLGRYNRMKYLAQKNIGYAQMGNTSVGVWLRKDKKQIQITRKYIEDSEYKSGQVLYDELLKGFDYIGSICIEMWRWMCADIETIEENGGEDFNSPEYEYMDILQFEVIPGKWEINHFYDTSSAKTIWSRLDLID